MSLFCMKWILKGVLYIVQALGHTYAQHQPPGLHYASQDIWRLNEAVLLHMWSKWLDQCHHTLWGGGGNHKVSWWQGEGFKPMHDIYRHFSRFLSLRAPGFPCLVLQHQNASPFMPPVAIILIHVVISDLSACQIADQPHTSEKVNNCCI